MSLPEFLSPPQVFRLVCRPALPKDTPDVLELTRTIWEGHDYVPAVWEEWLRDTEGLLAVAEYGGRVVGLVKLTRLSPGEWWLEGLRVHPEYEGRGIASHLHDYLMDYWTHKEGGVLRLVTASFRKSVHHLCERTGFLNTGEYTVFAAGGSDSQAGMFTLLQPDEAGRAFDFVLGEQWPSMPAGLMDLGWQWAWPSLERLADSIARGNAWWWGRAAGERDALLVARQGEDDEAGKALIVSLLACPAEDLVPCLGDYRCLAGSLGQKRAAWFAPLGAGLEPALLAAGFQREWEDSLYVFEKGD
jgi:GNAT superfamily N-acetyltransferase